MVSASAEIWNSVWERVRNGLHTMVVGTPTAPASSSDLKLFRVACGPPWTTMGPLLEVCQLLEELLGEEARERAAPLADEAGLWEQRPLSKVETVFVENCNRVARWGGGRCAVAFEAVDEADEVTLQSLAEILSQKDWLQLPLILCTARRSPAKVAELAALLGLESDVVEVPEGDAEQAASPAAFGWETLAPDVLRVMRGASVMGQTFEARLLADLLEDSLGSVLQSLQRAADAGAPIADRGGGVFSLPAEALGDLQRHLLPSLLAYLNERVGRLLSQSGSTLSPGPTANTGSNERTRPGPVPASSETAKPARPSRSETEKDTEDLAEVFEPGPRAVESAPNLEVPNGTPEQVEMNVAAGDELEARERRRSGRDQARAAAHLKAAGKTEDAVRQYLAAVRELASRGEVKRALMLGEQALELIGELPEGVQRSALSAEVLLERARLQWQGSGLGLPFQLKDALQTVERASAGLSHRVSKVLQGELAVLKAAICYDLGDVRSLEAALETLAAVSRELLAAGDSTQAARLLNDQAAIYLRQGDPVRATHLLSQSRRLFGRLLAQHPENTTLLGELADSEHLLARLALHARIRPERENEAFQLSLDYARRAERVYRQLGRRRELARVWETMGRLELGCGQPEAAWEHLSEALEAQRELGDATGLARSTAALADLCTSIGRLDEGIRLLVDSVRLNHRKGSPIGLAFNRRAAETLLNLLRRSDNAAPVGDGRALAELVETLEAAESAVGRISLPNAPRRVPVSG